MDAPRLPATTTPVAKPSKQNRWKAIEQLISAADELIGRMDELRDCQQRMWVYVYPDGAEKLPTDEELELSDYDMERLTECHELLAMLDPEKDYDDDGSLKKTIIRNRLAALVGAFPAGAPATPQVYTRMLLERVAAEDITALALETACREIESTKKFLPAISEVLPVIREHITAWSKRLDAIKGIKGYSARLIIELERPKKEAMKAALKEIDEARQKWRQAKQKIIEQQELAAKAALYAEKLLFNLPSFEERMRRADKAVNALIQRFRAEAKAITDGRPPEPKVLSAPESKNDEDDDAPIPDDDDEDDAD
jgi:hypothetical protein